ncbi:MAG: DUF2232 domain-containing protein [Alphaproteobacteria bacterium]
MSKTMLAIVGGGAVSGLLYVLAASNVMGAVLLVPLPLFLVGLGSGAAASLAAGGIGVLCAGGAGGFEGALKYALASAAPVALVTRQALLSRAARTGLEWYPPGLMLAWLTGFGLLVVTAAVAWYSGAPGGLEEEIRATLAAALERMAATPEQGRIEAFARGIAPILLGLGTAMWMMVIAIDGILAQGLLARFKRSLRPSPAVEDVDLPHWLVVALAAAVALTFIGGPAKFLGQNAIAVLGVPFFFAGLAVVHALVRRLSGGPLALFAFYVIMAIFGWPVLLVAGLGLIDQWVAFRARWRSEKGR